MRSPATALRHLRGSARLDHRIRAKLHRNTVQRRYRGRVRRGDSLRGSSLRPLLSELTLPEPESALAPTALRYAAGWFDLLGTGWRPFHTSDGSATPPLDWHVDVRSGYRWDPSTWCTDIDRAPGSGIDIKMPWELGRLQHLPQLALAQRYARDQTPGFESPDCYQHAIERQLVDFITENPPGYGVQWGCAMDASIRLVNILLTFDILAASEASLPEDVQTLLLRSVHDHAGFVAANLEWTRRARTNHYLADACGLVWAGAHLEGAAESDSWLCLGARELQAETVQQFDRDGAGREGSTSYHRLSAEMVVWTTAVLLSLPDDRLRDLAPDRACLGDVPLELLRQAPRACDVTVSRRHLRIVSRMPDLTLATSRLDSQVALIGDNDSGRFVKPAPAFRSLTVLEAVDRYRNLEGYDRLPSESAYWWEDATDHGHLIRAVGGLFEPSAEGVDGALVRGFLRHILPPPRRSTSLLVQVGTSRPPVGDSHAVRRETLVVPGGNDLLTNLQVKAFVVFGLYVWRSDRLFLTVRCGPIGQDGRGGHDHLDQLSLELVIDGVPWFVDPGSFTYTRDPDVRNAYRSARAHMGTGSDDGEDWGANPGLFDLVGLAEAGVPELFNRTGFVGSQRRCDGTIIRSIDLSADHLTIVDVLPTGSSRSVVLASAADAARLLGPTVPYSPGYGWQERGPGAPKRPRRTGGDGDVA